MLIWCPVVLMWEMFILTMPKDPIVENATSKNKMYLSLVWVEWLVVQNLESILQGTKGSFYSHPKD
jgi:hypothetical protein